METSGEATRHQDVIEQAMRLTGNDTLVVSLLDCTPGSTQARAAAGRLLSETGARLVANSPLAVFISGDGDIADTWRAQLPERDNTLWAQYEFLCQLYGCTDNPDAYLALCTLRERSADELGG
jgi:hypothetical protein